MDLDYDSHPADLKNVLGGVSVDSYPLAVNLINLRQHVNAQTDVKALRRSIPAHCFKPSYTTSLYYILRDIFLAGAFALTAYKYIPLIEDTTLRWLAWAFYGWIQGLFFTGLWVCLSLT